MNLRWLGNTGIRVSQVGLGTWPLAGSDGIPGYGPFDRERAEATVRAALETGVTLFDTADLYGAGIAERLLGELLGPWGSEVVVATKGGWDLERGGFNADPEFLVGRVAASRERLRREILDVYLLHNPPPRLLGLRSLYRPLLAMRERGWIRHLGVSVADVADAWLTLDRPEVEVVQLPYNLAIPEADRGLLQRLHEEGKGILVREALGNGLLTGKYGAGVRFSRDDFRSARTPELLRAAKEATAAWDRYRRTGEPWIQFALRFVLDRPEVSAVLVGARDPVQVDALAGAGSIAVPPREERQAAHLILP